MVDVNTGQKELIVSFAQLGDALRDYHPGVESKEMFIIYAVDRDDDRFFMRMGVVMHLP